MTTINNSTNNSHCNATLKGGMYGMATGAVVGAALYNLTKATMLPLKGETTFAQKRNFITDMQKMFASHSIDMKRTTISKTIKSSQKSLKSPLTIVSGLMASLIVGTAVGACIDAIKAKKLKQ